MIVRATQEQIEQCERITRNPFESDDVRFAAYFQPVTDDTGLFRHGTDWVPCPGCTLGPLGDDHLWEHIHLIAVGSNGGVRCFPFGSDVDLLVDVYSRVAPRQYGMTGPLS
jgi:hypothetical protein